MVIPPLDAMRDRESVAAAAGRSAALERELANGRKEIGQLREQLRAGQDERREAAERFSDATKKLKQATDDLEIASERRRALEAEASALQRARADAERNLAEARTEIERLKEEGSAHRRDFDAVRAKLAAAETEAKRVPGLETELHGAEEKLTAAMAEKHRLSQRCEEWRAESEQAKRDLLQTESGRELTAVRARFATSQEERQRLAAQLAETQGELRGVTQTERQLREEFDKMRRQRDDALSRAEANSGSALEHGNDVLRGILDRQKMELDERYAELRRLRAAQLSLRILYVSAGLLLFIAIVLGLRALHVMWM